MSLYPTCVENSDLQTLTEHPLGGRIFGAPGEVFMVLGVDSDVTAQQLHIES